jgi:hypothetical protein
MCHQRTHSSLGGEAGGRSLGFISLSLIRWATAEGRVYPSDAIAPGSSDEHSFHEFRRRAPLQLLRRLMRLGLLRAL